MTRVRNVVDALRSPRLARAVLLYVGAYSAVGAWLPWATSGGPPPPAWAEAVGLARPFSSLPFLAGVLVLLASTLACTWGKRARSAAAWRGEPVGAPLRLEPHPGRSLEGFLRGQGFEQRGPVLFRHRFALWGGWLLHVGLIALIAGVAVQQALHEGGNLQLVPGERKRLQEAGAVFQRERGLLAPASPPELEVALLEFDPFQHQAGYAPDRVSVVSLSAPGESPVTERLDRASGVRLAGVDVFQAIPTGLAAIVETPSLGRRALHLATGGPRSAFAEVVAAGGPPVRLVVETEHELDAPVGTGALRLFLEQGGRRVGIEAGQPISLGGEPARIVGFTRWAGFTYSRSPGMPLVYAGFGLVLLGAVSLSFPAGVARLSGTDGAAEVWLARGAEVLARRWRGPDAPRAGLG